MRGRERSERLALPLTRLSLALLDFAALSRKGRGTVFEVKQFLAAMDVCRHPEALGAKCRASKGNGLGRILRGPLRGRLRMTD